VDQATLVAEDIRSGASLIDALLASNFKVSAAFWIHEANTDNWRLVIASPEVRELGKERSYRRVQAVLQKGDVAASIDLSRVMLLSDADPEVAYIRSLSRGDHATSLVVPFSERIVGGRFVDSGYLYETEALGYLRDVSAALQRVAPPNAIIRSNIVLPEMPAGVTELPLDAVIRSSVALRDLGHDFIVDTGDGSVLIEAKATRRALPATDIEDLIVRKAHGSLPLLLIARSNLTPSAERLATRIRPRFKWVRWASREDDERLRHALNEFLSPR